MALLCAVLCELFSPGMINCFRGGKGLAEKGFSFCYKGICIMESVLSFEDKSPVREKVAVCNKDASGLFQSGS